MMDKCNRAGLEARGVTIPAQPTRPLVTLHASGHDGHKRAASKATERTEKTATWRIVIRCGECPRVGRRPSCCAAYTAQNGISTCRYATETHVVIS